MANLWIAIKSQGLRSRLSCIMQSDQRADQMTPQETEQYIKLLVDRVDQQAAQIAALEAIVSTLAIPVSAFVAAKGQADKWVRSRIGPAGKGPHGRTPAFDPGFHLKRVGETTTGERMES